MSKASGVRERAPDAWLILDAAGTVQDVTLDPDEAERMRDWAVPLYREAADRLAAQERAVGALREAAREARDDDYIASSTRRRLMDALRIADAALQDTPDPEASP